MESHPIATAEQHEHERRALELTQHPVVKEAFERVRAHWLGEAAPSPAMRACFDAIDSTPKASLRINASDMSDLMYSTVSSSASCRRA